MTRTRRVGRRRLFRHSAFAEAHRRNLHPSAVVIRITASSTNAWIAPRSPPMSLTDKGSTQSYSGTHHRAGTASHPATGKTDQNTAELQTCFSPIRGRPSPRTRANSMSSDKDKTWRQCAVDCQRWQSWQIAGGNSCDTKSTRNSRREKSALSGGTTQIYLDANLALKEEFLAKTTPPEGEPGRYWPDDQRLAFLKGLAQQDYAEQEAGPSCTKTAGFAVPTACGNGSPCRTATRQSGLLPPTTISGRRVMPVIMPPCDELAIGHHFPDREKHH